MSIPCACYDAEVADVTVFVVLFTAPGREACIASIHSDETKAREIVARYNLDPSEVGETYSVERWRVQS